MKAPAAGHWPRKGYFITATDTGVGKTVFTAALAACMRAAGLNVVALKPIAAGAVIAGGRRVSADALFLERAAVSGEALDEINPILLKAPAAPSVAARLEGAAYRLHTIVAHCRRIAALHEYTLVEGVGGLMVPLTDRETVADLAAALDLPLIVVARPGLGTINHTALTVEYARARGLRVAGIVISGTSEKPDLAERSGPGEIERLTGRPILARLPFVEGLDVDSGRTGDWQRITAAIDLSRFI